MTSSLLPVLVLVLVIESVEASRTRTRTTTSRSFPEFAGFGKRFGCGRAEKIR